MLNTDDYIEQLLGFKGVVLKNIIENETERFLTIELERKIHNCPCCRQQTNQIHDYRLQQFKDAPLLGKNTIFLYRKRRYVCSHCDKRFYEKNNFLS